jgi:Domain of unknown function (DUF4388)/GYF domain 2/Tetratricopeptide repeat
MSAAKWFYVQDDKRVGPVDVDHLVHLVVTSVLAPTALVWHQGLAEWTEAEKVAEIVALLPPPLPPGKKPGPIEPPPLPPRAAPAAAKAPEKAEKAEKADKPAAKSAEKPAEKPAEKAAERVDKPVETPPAPAAPPASSAATAAVAPPPAPVAANPRLEELRQKLEKEPSPRAYGLLAEELRKAGDFAEAIRISRQGVESAPAYPSLRVTLGRALLEHGDLAEALSELEAVVLVVPDNILAERFLGECLEALGDRTRARAQYLKALALAPGDAQLVARLRALSATGAPANGPQAAAAPDQGPPAHAEASHTLLDADPLAGMLDDSPPMHAEIEPPSLAIMVDDPSPAPAADPPPIPLAVVEDTFEIERANDHAAGTTASKAVPSPKRKAAGGDRGTKTAEIIPPTPPPAGSSSVVIDFEVDVPADPLALAPAVSSEPTTAPIPPPAAPPAVTLAAGFPGDTPSGSFAKALADAAPPLPKGRAGVDGKPGPALVPEETIAWPSGRVADHEFADLVREVYGRRWSGLLTLNHTGVEKSVRVQDGRLVFAFSSSRDDRLGELLLRRGRITLHQYVEASRAIRKGIRLGTVLVEQGALDARDLVKSVMDHTQEIIYSAFQWTEGLYHFTEGAAASEPITLKLSTPDVILEGIRRIDHWSRIERAVGSIDTRYVRARGYEDVLSEMTLSLEKLSILTGLEMEQDVGTICRNSTLSHYEVCRTLWAYRVIGVVQRLADPSSPD